MEMENVKRYGGILVKHENEVLLCKRNADGDLPGVWSIPAGRLEKNESALNGCKREFFEETNIQVNGDLKLIGFVGRTNREGTTKKGLLYVFLWETDEKIYPDLENAEDGEEHTECGYFSKENLPFTDENDQLCKLIKNILQ